jgi:hypothetical protein
MKLKKATEIVQQGGVIYDEHVGEIELKVKILEKRNTFRSLRKAAQWKEVLKQNFWNIRKEKNEQ